MIRALVLATALVVMGSPAAVAAGTCTVDDATLSWGFKESFRSYISSSIANGQWTVADGATYETPDFGWADGTGNYDAATGVGLVGFGGAITFTGHGGILDTTVANPHLRFIDQDSAVLLLDVFGTTQQGDAVDERQVEFVELDLSGAVELAGDTLTVTDAPAVLTASGAAAFGTYSSGEAFDPVSLTIDLDPACATAPTSSPTHLWAWVLGTIALAAAVVLAVVLRRRRA